MIHQVEIRRSFSVAHHSADCSPENHGHDLIVIVAFEGQPNPTGYLKGMTRDLESTGAIQTARQDLEAIVREVDGRDVHHFIPASDGTFFSIAGWIMDRMSMLYASVVEVRLEAKGDTFILRRNR